MRVPNRIILNFFLNDYKTENDIIIIAVLITNLMSQSFTLSKRSQV